MKNLPIWLTPAIRSARHSGVTPLVSVRNATSETWPAPEIHDHTGSPVNSWSPVKPGTSQANIAHFVLRDARLKVNDAVAPLWLFSDGTGLGVDVITVTTAGEARTEIPAAVLAESLSKTVQVSYLPILAGVLEPLSETLNLQVLTFTYGQLVAPTIAEGALDLNTFSGDAHVLAEPWPLIAAGQTFWLMAEGIHDDGSAYTERLPTPYTVQSAEVAAGIRRVLERPQLLRLENASMLRITLKVDFTGSSSETSATLFPVGEVSMNTVSLNLIAPTVVGAVDGMLDPSNIPGAGVVVRVPAYDGREIGQWVYVEFNGQGGSREVTPARQIVDLTTPMDFSISKAEVVKSKGSAGAFDYKVARVQQGAYIASVPVPVEVDVVGGAMLPTLREDFEQFQLGSFTSPVQLQGVTIEFPNGSQLQVKEEYSTAGAISGKYLSCYVAAYRQMQVHINFQPGVKKVAFGLRLDSPDFLENAMVYHAAGEEIMLTINNRGTAQPFIFNYVSMLNFSDISRISIRAATRNVYLSIDNLFWD